MALGYCKLCDKLVPIEPREYVPGTKQRYWYPVPDELFMRSMRFTALFVGLIEARTAKGEQPGDIMRFIAKTCCGPYAATPN